jgi:VCBS repeat protein
MFLRKPILVLAIAFVTVGGMRWCHLPTPAGVDVWAPYIAATLPQHAFGDFDGDGRPDLARIQDLAGRPQISVSLSGSSTDVRLEASVSVLIDGDVDHDGDLDLVGATASGDVFIWLNDGHGRFTRQEPSRSHGVAGEAAMVDVEWSSPAAIGTTAPLVVAPSRSETAVIHAQIRRPTAPLSFDRHFLGPQSLRAPPIPAA